MSRASSSRRESLKVPMSHTSTAVLEEEASFLPSGEKATASTERPNPSAVNNDLPLGTSHICKVWELPPATSVLPSDEKATWDGDSSELVSVLSFSPVCAFHSWTSLLPQTLLARISPSGDSCRR